ncbi:Clp protease N-terminal domain-containing protein [Actinopolymorpha sp. B11F2]|uniref:Clp protease N-terminal domain-containing protein n=1 Tax=Actinopolymorpha sp. B11F2 TaxID=3160862 RepID=UPI0032E50A78
MAPAPSLHELIETVRTDAASDDVLDQLAAARGVVAELSETGDAVLGHFVDRARGSGRSWTEISNVLGVTKQAVHKRFAGANLFIGEGAPTFERFTVRARRTVDATRPAAVALGHSYIGTEHLLLAFYAEPEGIAGKLLLDAGISRDDVEAEIIARTGRGQGSTDMDPPWTPRAKGALAASLAEALKLGHNYIGTEHLLLAMYDQPDAIAQQILLARGLDAEAARNKVVEALTDFQKK